MVGRPGQAGWISVLPSCGALTPRERGGCRRPRCCRIRAGPALSAMAQPPPDVSEDECLPEYRYLFCPDLLR